MSEQTLLVDVGLVVLVALVLGIISTRFLQSSALGYVLAGILLGPLALKYLVPGEGLSPIFGEIGFLMLMFYLGLELNIRKFRETGGISVILAIAQMATAFVGGYVVARFFGFGELEAIALGAMLVATSTVIVAKFLIDKGIIDRVDSRIALSVLMLQDFFAIFVLVFLTSLSEQKQLNVIVLNALLFMIGMFFIVSKISRHVLNFLHSIGHGNKMVFYALGVGVIVSYAGVTLGLSAALGAYFAGFALAETAFGDRIKRELGFFREFFVLFFFVSFGTSLFFDSLSKSASVPALESLLPLVGIALVLAAVYVFGSILAFLLAGMVLGIDRYVVGNVAMLLIPLGEFVILIASAMKPLLSPAGFDQIVTLAFLLILFTAPITPFFYDNSRRITDLFFSRVFPRAAQKALGRAGAGISHLEQLASSDLSRSKLLSSVEQMAKNLLIAFAVVYLTVLLGQQAFETSVLPGLPKELSIGFFALLLVIWPLYKFVAELKFLVEQASEQIVHSAFPAVRKSALLVEDELAGVFTGFILVLIGVLGTVVFYYSFPQSLLYLIIPVSYTILSLMHLSKAIYSLIEQFDTIGEVEERQWTLEGAEQFKQLSREFDESTKNFRLLHLEREKAREKIRQALRQGDMKQVRSLLTLLKRKEQKLLGKLFKEKREDEELLSAVRSLDTKKAFENYLLKRAAHSQQNR